MQNPVVLSSPPFFETPVETVPFIFFQIAEKILAFLPTRRVQDLRLLSSLWNMEGLKALRNRVVVSPFNITILGDVNWPEDQLQISAYAHSLLGQLGFPD